MSVYVARIACDDGPGLIHQITGVLLAHGANVIENQEFVDHRLRRFFMRAQFEGATEPGHLRRELLARLPTGAQCEVRQLQPRRLVILVSREPHCLGDLLLRHFTGEMKVEIAAVLSPNPECRDLTERFGIAFHHVPLKLKDRAEHEQRLLAVIAGLAPDYLVLARFMRILSAPFIAHFPDRIINIHHSFLPAFIGKDPYEQAHQRGVKIIGATSHFVTEALDEGPILTQDVIAVDHTCSPEAMAKRGQDVEKLVLVRGLELVLEDRVLIDGNRTVVFT